MCTKVKIKLFIVSLLTMQALNADRLPAVAGSFYSDNKKELSSQVTGLLLDAKDSSKENINALIVPHAGYLFSADTAAVAYKTLHKKYKNIFLLGSSHHLNFEAASIYTSGNYQTPLGTVKMSEEIISELMKHKLFTYEKGAHTKEHTLEVQLPFLQTVYGDELSIVPIIVGTQNMQNILELSKILQPYFEDEENLFIVSSDLSHYPLYMDANSVDKRTLDAVVANNPQIFIDTLIKNEKSLSQGLLTSACGWSSILILLNMTQNDSYKYELLQYKNSGDTEYGDKERVVGYGALRVYKEALKSFLTQGEKDELLEIANLALYEATLNNKRVIIDKEKLSPKLQEHLGAFVTLHKNNQLRGCIGRFEPNQPLYEVVVDMAIAASKYDTRFNPVIKDELKNIDIEISVLTPRKRINSLDEIIIGKHGVYVQKGSLNGTYLPHVATQMNWNNIEFAHDCAIQKAGIRRSEVAESEFFVYEAIVFEEK